MKDDLNVDATCEKIQMLTEPVYVNGLNYIKEH